MRSLRLFLLALVTVALASPAPAQSISNDRQSGGRDAVYYGGRGGDRGGGRGIMHGGRGAFGILPGLLIPAIADGLRHGQNQRADRPLRQYWQCRSNVASCGRTRIKSGLARCRPVSPVSQSVCHTGLIDTVF